MAYMKGLIMHPKIKDEDLLLLARKKGHVNITFVTPDNKSAFVVLEVTKQTKGYTRVLLNTYSSNYDISSEGQKNFRKYERNISDPDDRKEVFCGKRVMRIDVKETGEGMVLAFMLLFLEDGKNIEKIML
jgi:hypothetical protein